MASTPIPGDFKFDPAHSDVCPLRPQGWSPFRAGLRSNGGRLTSVGGRSDGLLLANPCLLILDITEELLQTQRVGQLLLPGDHGLLERFVASHEGFLLLLDVFSVKMASVLELAGLNGDAIDPILGMEKDGQS